MRYAEQVALMGTERRKEHTEFWYWRMKRRNSYDYLIEDLEGNTETDKKT